METYIQICDFLMGTWNEQIVKRFIDMVEEKLHNLHLTPLLGKYSGQFGEGVRQTIIHQDVVLNYRYDSDPGVVILLSFWDTRSDH